MSPSPVPEIDPVLCAAAELFEKRGYDDVSVEMVAERAGVGRSTAFARYLSKQGILIGIVQTFLYQFPLYLAQLELSPPPSPAERSRPPRLVPKGAARRIQTPPPLPPAVAAAEPGPARLMSALEEFCRQWGPLARVALAARDLPWVRRALGTQPCLFQNAIRLYLGPGAGSRTLCSIATDMLKHACAAGGNGTGAGNGNGHSTTIDPGERAYLIELLSVVCKHQPNATAGLQDAAATAASLRATPPPI
jgi:AcrR family transcriptional regulator